MGVFAGPEINESGLVLALDVSNRKCISPLGCTGFNNAPQLVKNIISPSDVITGVNGIKLGNLSYYTAFAIDYPEYAYGGDAASRQGITPGYNVRSGGKTFDFGRALNYAVYNNITQSWVKTTIYDTYAYSSEVDRFVSEYATAVTTYPDAVHLVAGSHRDSNHSAAQYNILRDLGAPSNVDSIIGFSSPEWILIGKPGLGAGNAYGWVFQNYSTNPDQVAHLNFGLPIYGTKDNYLEFDGSDDVIKLTGTESFNFGSVDFTIECWVYFNVVNVTQLFVSKYLTWGSNADFFFRLSGGDAKIYFYSSPFNLIVKSNVLTTNTWHHICVSRNSNITTFYVNGISGETSSTVYTVSNNKNELRLGLSHDNDEPLNGRMSNVRIYKGKGLTATEVSQNFNALRGRYGL
jgi:hypothetical protein